MGGVVPQWSPLADHESMGHQFYSRWVQFTLVISYTYSSHPDQIHNIQGSNPENYVLDMQKFTAGTGGSEKKLIKQGSDIAWRKPATHTVSYLTTRRNHATVVSELRGKLSGSRPELCIMVPRWYQRGTKVVQSGTKKHVSRPYTAQVASPGSCFWLITETETASN